MNANPKSISQILLKLCLINWKILLLAFEVSSPKIQIMPLSRYFLRIYYPLFLASTSFTGILILNIVFIIIFSIFLFPYLYIPKNIKYYFIYFYVVFISLKILHIVILSSLPTNFNIPISRSSKSILFFLPYFCLWYLVSFSAV